MSSEKELEAVLMDYIARYGLTEKARALFTVSVAAKPCVPSSSTLEQTKQSTRDGS